MAREMTLAVVLLATLLATPVYGLVTFESAPSDNDAIRTTPLTTEGFTFTSGHYHIIGAASEFGGPVNGTQYIAEEAGSLGLPITMTRADGGTFSLLGFDGAGVFVSPPAGFPNATSIDVSGVQAGGGELFFSFPLDGVIDGAGGMADFQTFTLPATWTNLVSVTFSGSRVIGETTATGGISLDNINAVVSGGVIATVAGTGVAGFNGDGAPATAKQLNFPMGAALGGSFCIADGNNHMVRCVDDEGNIATLAGTGAAGYNGDGINAFMAELNGPTGVAIDAAGNVFIADSGNHAIRKVSPPNGSGIRIITTVAGTPMTPGFRDGNQQNVVNDPANAPRFWFPRSVAVALDGDLIIADSVNQRLRRWDAATQNITTIAGTGLPRLSGDGGLATSADLNSPISVVMDGAAIIFADEGNHRIRKIDAAGIISTVAGSGMILVDATATGGGIFHTGASGCAGDGGQATAALLNSPSGVAVDESGNIYIADLANNRVRRVDGEGDIATLAGTGTDGFDGDGGPATAALLKGPIGVAAGSGELLIVDLGNQRIRRVPLQGAPTSNSCVVAPPIG